jgi:hypothetical protein
MSMAEGSVGVLDSAGVDDRESVRDEVAKQRKARHPPPLACANQPWSYMHMRSAGMKG